MLASVFLRPFGGKRQSRALQAGGAFGDAEGAGYLVIDATSRR